MRENFFGQSLFLIICSFLIGFETCKYYYVFLSPGIHHSKHKSQVPHQHTMIKRRRTRTTKIRTALSRPCLAGQRTAFFRKFRTESGQRTESRQTKSGQKDIAQSFLQKSGQQTDSGHDIPENPDKNETRTGHGQCCPPTSDSYSLPFI